MSVTPSSKLILLDGEPSLKQREEHDAAAIAELFTPDAVEVFRWGSEGGAAVGQQGIRKRYESEASEGSATNMTNKLVQIYAIGSDICAFADRSVMMWKNKCLVIFVRDADTWKIRMAYATY